jgi:riboflavin biosynthesis pyrimidine reductase
VTAAPLRRLLPGPVEPADPAADYAYPESITAGSADGGHWLRANMIGTLDGAATLLGRSGGLGNAADRTILGLLRGAADCILVGAGTVRAEGYGAARLDQSRRAARLAAGRSGYPAMAIVSNSLDLDLDAPVYADPATMVVTSAAADPARRAAAAERCEVLVTGTAAVDLGLLVRTLADRGHRRLLCEGGPTLLGALVQDALLDELCLSLSPVLGGAAGPRIVSGLGGPRPLQLAHVLESEGLLFLRYLAAPAAPSPPATAGPG